jgi:hypothetical protein
MIKLVLFALLLSACTSDTGILEGTVTIGPLCPTEPCNPSEEQLAQLYDTVYVEIYKELELFQRIGVDNKGFYKAELPPGIYLVNVPDVGMLNMEPEEVNIAAGKKKILDFEIDTGIR